MSELDNQFKTIKNSIIKGVLYCWLPFYLFGLSIDILDNSPGLRGIIALITIILFCYGYGVLGNAIHAYTQYKGYKNYFYIYSILNVVGLSIVFLLKNKHEQEKEGDSLEKFSVSAIWMSYFSISLLLYILVYLFIFLLKGNEYFAEYIADNSRTYGIEVIFFDILCCWYFVRHMKQVDLKYKKILGAFKKIDFKLPLILTINKYLFNIGFNSFTLYGLSFIVPQYVENQLNRQYATTSLEWIAFVTAAVIFAPIIEESFFRGIILQKIALKKGITKGILVSAIAFSLIHFRYDLIPLFITGIIYALLYLKTEQLAVPMLAHCFYNSIVVIRRIYYHYLSADPVANITVSQYQQQFIDNWQWKAFYIAISTPYLVYFIYKNFPRNYDTKKLPYYTN